MTTIAPQGEPNKRRILFAPVFFSLLTVIFLAFLFSAFHHNDQKQAAIDTTVLRPNAPGCKITASNGKNVDLSAGGIIPKGTLITGACFDTKE
jgi:hypothetical protein